MDQPAKKTMGSLIAALRKEQRMTQADLAEKMHVTDKAVSKWERDLSYPDIHTLPLLAEVLGISVEELMQCRAVSSEQPIRKDVQGTVDSILNLVFRALTLAMGVAVLVLSIMDRLDMQTGFTLLGLGLACGGVSLLRSHT